MTRTVSSQRGLDGPSDTSPPTLAGDSCARTTRPASTIRERTSLMRGLMSGIRRDRPGGGAGRARGYAAGGGGPPPPARRSKSRDSGGGGAPPAAHPPAPPPPP